MVYSVNAAVMGADVRALAVRPDGVRSIPPPPRPAPAEWQLDLTGPRFPMPARNEFYLFEGEVHAALRIGH
jgi:hypothetical protein